MMVFTDPHPIEEHKTILTEMFKIKSRVVPAPEDVVALIIRGFDASLISSGRRLKAGDFVFILIKDRLYEAEVFKDGYIELIWRSRIDGSSAFNELVRYNIGISRVVRKFLSIGNNHEYR
jgi:hypothetical protein